MGVALQIRKVADRLAKGTQSSQAIWTATTLFWTIIDAAADQPFENRMKGSEITDLDTALGLGTVWRDPVLQRLFVLMDTYCLTDLGLIGKLDSYLSSVAGMRVPYEFGEAYYRAMGTRLSTYNVFGKGTLVATGSDPTSAGMHQFGYWTGNGSTDTYTSVSGAITTTKMVASPIVMTSREATPGGSSPVVTVTLQDATTKDIAVMASAAQYGQVVVAEQAITAASGATISCAATAQFKVGEYVLLYENAEGDTSIREVGKILTVNANTSIVLTAAPVNAFTSAGKIRPMFTNITKKSGTITSGKHVDFWALPDRIIAM